MEFDHLTLDGLKASALAHYEYASACLRASAQSLYGDDFDAQNYLDAPDYFEETINAVKTIREITREIRRRMNGLSHHDAETV